MSLSTPGAGACSHTGPRALLLGVHNGAATLENSLAVVGKTEDGTHILGPDNFMWGVHSKTRLLTGTGGRERECLQQHRS